MDPVGMALSPEFKTQVDCVAFPVNFYRLGNVIWEGFTNVRIKYLVFTLDIGDHVGDGNPTKRPTTAKVVPRLEGIIEGVSGWKLWYRIVSKDNRLQLHIIRSPGHWQGGLPAQTHPCYPKGLNNSCPR